MRDKNESGETVTIEGEIKQVGQPRKPQKSGDSISVTIPMVEIVKKAILAGMDVADFIKNYRLVFYSVTPPGGNVILDGWTVVRFEKRPGRKDE